MSQETTVKRTIGFTADPEETKEIKAPTITIMESAHESTVVERLLTKLLNTVRVFTLLLLPVYLASPGGWSLLWLLLWGFMFLNAKLYAGRD
jgi:hypothetical protein